MIRQALAGAFFLIGHAICVVFDRWLPWGMPGPIYAAYNGAMVLSDKLQGDGPGPWNT